MDKSVAISVRNVSKTFVIPHERINTMRGAFVSLFKNKNYESFKALDNISFDVRQGEFVGIIGKNGSGKSTLLRILAGIYQPDRGKVQIHGQISPFLELGIGFNPELSGRDNIYLNGILLGLTKKEIDKKFDEIVAFSELERFIDQKLKNYSSGMQVRLAFSVAIFANRDILLLDEVMAVGDMAFKEKSFQKIWEFHTQGKTIILVTHDSDVVTQYCDTAILLSEGKMLVKGDPQQAINIYTHMS
jgi:ABC-2 type transport system ATP-binding protein